MQGRRTFGATTQLALKVTAGEHWMGERFVTKRSVPIQIEVHGTAPIATVEIFVDGEVKKIFSCESVDEKLTYEPGAGVRGQHIYYVRVKQTDGNRAWSSPIWMDVQQ
jgi:hypothetical protein